MKPRVPHDFPHDLACVARIRRGGKGERQASEVREDRTQENRGRSLLPPTLILTFLPPFLRPATQASAFPPPR